MIRCALPTVVILVLAFTWEANGTANAAPPVVWEVAEGIAAPESVYYHADGPALFVSNIGEGGPTGKDGDGYVSKLDLDGQVVKRKWATGLNSPKGMRVHGSTLWVSDIDRLVGIDVADGRIVQSVPVPTATFLNDVACDADGAVYVSDTRNSRIFRYAEDKVAVFAEGANLECPNGLLVDGDRLVIAAWGRAPAADFTTKVPGRLLALNLKTKKLTAITEQPVGNLDGLEVDGQGGYYLTDWMAGKVLHVAPDGGVKVTLQLTKGTADLAYLPGARTLIVPRMLDNKVTAFKLSD